MTQLFQCVACLHTRTGRLRPMFCEQCGRSETYAISDSPTGLQAIAATDIEIKELEKTPTKDESLDSMLRGGFVRPSTLTAYGPAGVGKSRSCLRWATNMGRTLLVSLEMPQELSVHSAYQARSNLSNLFIVEHEDWQTEAQRVRADILVFDSLHYSTKQRVVKGTKVPLVLWEIAEWTKKAGTLAFVVAHQNKKGRVSGTTAAEHWPDYLFKFERHGGDEAKIVCPKSRYSPSGSAIVTI